MALNPRKGGGAQGSAPIIDPRGDRGRESKCSVESRRPEVVKGRGEGHRRGVNDAVTSGEGHPQSPRRLPGGPPLLRREPKRRKHGRWPMRTMVIEDQKPIQGNQSTKASPHTMLRAAASRSSFHPENTRQCSAPGPLRPGSAGHKQLPRQPSVRVSDRHSVTLNPLLSCLDHTILRRFPASNYSKPAAASQDVGSVEESILLWDLG